MKVVIAMLALVALAAGTLGCGESDNSAADPPEPRAEPAFATVAPADVASDVRQGKILLVDVREDDEWNAGHAPRALHVPLADVERRLRAIVRRSAGRPVAFICSSGRRSAQAATIAVDNGLDDVVSVDGGMGAWVRAGLPLVPRNGRVI